MSRISIPNPKTRKFSAIFPGEYAGSFYLTKNLNLHRSPGKVLLGESLSAVFHSGTDSNLGLPVAFVRTAADGTDRWWANAGAMFKTTGTNPEVGWIRDSLASSPTAGLYDAREFLDALLVPTDTDIARLSTTWNATYWTGTLAQAALVSGVPHRFAVFAGALLITDGRLIHTYDGTTVTNSDLTLPNELQSQWIVPLADYAMIGCDGVGDNQKAEIFLWDRTSGTFNARYAVGDRAILCGFVANGIPYIITKRGEIKRFNGNGFRTVNQFPTVELSKDIRNIHPNGVVVNEGIVTMNVDFGVSSSITDERLMSGLWVFDTDTFNLFHSNSHRNGTGRDYGQLEVASVGAMVATQPGWGRYLAGANLYTVYPGTIRSVISSFDEEATESRGYFITSKIRGEQAEALFQQIILKFRRFLSSGDRIRILYRRLDSNAFPRYETITWLSANEFTSSDNQIVVGDFVEPLAGDNAGALAKITGISGTTITVDRVLNTSTAVARVRYLRFTDLGTISDQSVQRALFRFSQRSEWIQFLVSMEGGQNSPAFEELSLLFTDSPI